MTLSDDTSLSYEASPLPTGNYNTFNYIVEPGQEFIGFKIEGKASGCIIAELKAYTRDTACVVVLDLAQIN